MVSGNEAPSMNNSLKRLFSRRKKSLAKYSQLRNKVNRVRKACRAKYYDAKSQGECACPVVEGNWTANWLFKGRAHNPIADLQHLAEEGEDPENLTLFWHQYAHSPHWVRTPTRTSLSYIWVFSHHEQSIRTWWNPLLGNQRKCRLIGCTSGRHLEFFLSGRMWTLHLFQRPHLLMMLTNTWGPSLWPQFFLKLGKSLSLTATSSLLSLRKLTGTNMGLSWTPPQCMP